MSTLLFRLQAPLQSWGISSHFSVRDSCREPTKSGVIGLICAAMGRKRNSSINDLADLRMGVRVDREGKLMKDYQIAQDVYKADGGKPKESEPSNRYFLSDAVFLVGLEGDLLLLQAIYNALQKPKWALYLGRRAFPPSSPVWLSDGLHDGNLLENLTSYPLLTPHPENCLRVVIDDENGTVIRNDVPVSFSDRLFTNRNIFITYIEHSGEIIKGVEDVVV